MSRGLIVRDATERDAGACAAIYAPYVTDTVITFESHPPSPAEMAVRISAASRTHAWLALEDEGRVVGYAYGGPHQSRLAYRWSCEVSVYLELGRGAPAAAGPSTTSCSPASPSAGSAWRSRG